MKRKDHSAAPPDIRAQLDQARARASELEQELKSQATRDSLTGLLNLRELEARAHQEVERARRYERPLCAMLVDLDGFRRINERCGIDVGDRCLRLVASLVSEHTRQSDIACRTGGDEFAIILPETEAGEAVALAGRILKGLETLPIDGLGPASASVGLCDFRKGDHIATLFARANRALAVARAEGGGRVRVYNKELEDPVVDPTGAEHNREVIEALAVTLAERDNYTGDHSEFVLELARTVAEQLGLDSEQIADVEAGALLHDIGKVGIPNEILQKPTELDESEWEMMRQHTLIGERIVRSVPGLGRVARIVRHEHERWDGRGYPDGLVAEEIPIGSRIILACDAYHAMTSNRPYRKAMTHAEAIRELHSNAGSQFDAEVVEAIIGSLYALRQLGGEGAAEGKATPEAPENGSAPAAAAAATSTT